nr:MAG TPA: hypothetical protein [Caudoviricetes sp.]DAT01104.1 MAG TPA: hypothetical protein [Caudoviricetes sp.]
MGLGMYVVLPRRNASGLFVWTICHKYTLKN